MLHAYARLLEEFPHFQGEALPAMPEGFKDFSWHNDICPHIRYCMDIYREEWLCIYIEHSNPDMRDFPGMPRFALQTENLKTDLRDVLLETDDWNAILEMLAAIEPSLWGPDSENEKCRNGKPFETCTCC